MIMWTKIIVLCTALIKIISATGKVDVTTRDGVKSVEINRVVYGDEDMTIINQIVSEEDSVLKTKINLNEAITPLPAEDVKCLMSVDRYCSKDMGEVKGVLIQAIKNDCLKCSTMQKERAGKIIASMMAHDPVAWKLFLTRTVLQNKSEKRLPHKEEKVMYKIVGEPVEIENTRNRYTAPGFKVRVKRYDMEKFTYT